MKISKNGFDTQQLYKNHTYNLQPDLAQQLVFFNKANYINQILEQNMNQYPFIQLKTKPANRVFTLQEVKDFLRVDSNYDNDLINNLQIAVTEVAEKYTSKALIYQTWQIIYDNLQENKVILPISPIVSISSIKQIDKYGNEHILNVADYELCKIQNTVSFLNYLYNSNKTIIEYVAGYSDDSLNIPQAIKQGILNHIGHIYDGKGEVAELPLNTKILYSAYKKMRL